VSKCLHPRLRDWLPPSLVLAYLWFTLINHLRIEWTANPHCSYGWVVPVLCLYLAHLGIQRLGDCGQGPGSGIQNSSVSHSPDFSQPPPVTSTLLLCALAFAWLPIRLVQEANPEWRLVSWAMAIAVVSLTLLVIHLNLRPKNFHTSVFVFPILFFLVAVPWPTAIEGPLIQALTYANASCATEIINLFGIPAVQHGNLIEVGTGVLGIDEACSGIRSFQATVMISLFLGELYWLPVHRRLYVCLLGFALSFVYNVCRTTFLTWITARDGGTAIQRWHDPAGFIILVLCFSNLWLLALCLRPRLKPGPLPCSTRDCCQDPQLQISRRKFTPALLIWFLLCEFSTAAWYRLHEAHATQVANWTVTWPTNNPSFHELPISDRTRHFLRYDEGSNSEWIGADGLRRQVIFLRWIPGKIAVHLARGHTPQVCLPATGRQILSTSEVQLLNAAGVALPFRHYVVNDGGRPMHVFYCLWEDRGAEQDLRPTDLTLRNRLEPVLSGRRNLGQRSLEIAIWGTNDAKEAEESLVQELKELIKVEK